jgi:hypothetical protein
VGQELRFGRGIEGLIFGVHRPGRRWRARPGRLVLDCGESRAELAGDRKQHGVATRPTHDRARWTANSPSPDALQLELSSPTFGGLFQQSPVDGARHSDNSAPT